jgi:hypothetical protein
MSSIRVLLCALVAIPLLASPDPPADAFAFFQPTVTLKRADRQTLGRGDGVVTILDGARGELAVFSAIRLGPQVTLERAAGWLRHVEALRKSRFLLASGRFSSSPELADLEGLTLDDEDVQDVRRCRPGKCKLKLSAAEIAELQAVIASAQADWRREIERAFRHLVVRRIAAYLAGGHANLEPHSDRTPPRAIAATFEGIVMRSGFLHHQIPHLARRLATCRWASLPGTESFIYWSKERLAGKAVISATHVTIMSRVTDARSQVLMIGVQIFATHYLDASLGVTVVTRDEQSSSTYLAYVNRSHVDVLEGFWGGLARGIIEARIRKDGPGMLREAAERMSRGDAPAIPFRHDEAQP